MDGERVDIGSRGKVRCWRGLEMTAGSSERESVGVLRELCGVEEGW